MIECPNCNHANPDVASVCEECSSPLSTVGSMGLDPTLSGDMTQCPNCGVPIQQNATFCGSCGTTIEPKISAPEPMTNNSNIPDIPDLLVNPDTMTNSNPNQQTPLPTVIATSPTSNPTPPTQLATPDPDIIPVSYSPVVNPDPMVQPMQSTPFAANPDPMVQPMQSTPVVANPDPITPVMSQPTPVMSKPMTAGKTQLQVQKAFLLHIQTNTKIELPDNVSVVHLGKPNDQIPPDIDVSGFPNSEVVSRVHSDIRIEGDAFYIEDVGSANGTYINHTPLPRGNRHRLRTGDRIALGKNDLVTFLFQIGE